MASIRDVAEKAGVSIATVSRVINGSPRVAGDTLLSVRSAMAELRYLPSDRRPGPKPSSRNKTRSVNIAFLVLGTSANRVTPAFQELLYGVSTATSEQESNLIFSHVPDPSKLPPVLDQRVDGLLLHGNIPTGAVRERLEKLPTVWLMGNRRRPDFGDQIMPDAYSVGELAASFLLSRGHTRLAFLNLDEEHLPLRVYGHAFAATAKAEGGPDIIVHELQEHPIITSPGYWRRPSQEAVDHLVDRFLALPDRPTGIFVAEDRQVALLQPALQARGVRIGRGGGGGGGGGEGNGGNGGNGGVEIVSCNNERPYLVGLSPQPTEIDIRTAAVGRRGVEQLLWRLTHPEVTEQVVATVEPRLVPAS